MRIAVLQFSHETVSFLKFDTTIEDFTYEGSPARGEALLQASPRGYMGGFVKVAREFEGVELVGIESPLSSRRGSASGFLTEDTYEHFVGKMISELKAQGPFDGVYMSLHGAMAVRGIPKPEAELARRVREVVGPNAFIAATFDPHGNEDEDFLKYANLAFCIKYYPHYDGYHQGERAARTLVRSIRGDYKPTTATRKPPILTPSVLQWTGSYEWMSIVQRALTWEAREPDVYVNFFYGFAFADVPDVGMCFEVTTNGNPELAQYIANDMAMAAWRKREELFSGTKVHLHKDAVAEAKKALAAGKTPIVLADHSDRTGYATQLLEQISNQGLSDTLIGTVADKKAIDELRAKGVKVGDPFDMEIGGLVDVSAGKAVRIKGVVNTVSGGIGRGAAKSQLWVSVKFGNNNVLVISPFISQITDPRAFLPLGINPDDFKVIAIKSRVHFRRGFDDNGYAKTILLTEPDEPFLGTIRVEALPYQHTNVNKFYPHNKTIDYKPEGYNPAAGLAENPSEG
ncbi:M81 family metallopeptidase [Oleiharenicola lentus]|uniref:M81 family metallopeptidase n=1 Tax=Oleiharenicola lentus TaxID=2508720 RepID=UPI003F662E17